MTNFIYDEATRKVANKELDWDTDDIRLLLVMTDTTADTERDKLTISGFTTLDEVNGSGYARQTLAGKSLTKLGTPDHLTKFDHDDVAFGALGAGSRAVQAGIYYLHVTDDTDSVPLAYVDDAAEFPLTLTGAPFTWIVNANGAVRIKNA